MFQEFSDNPMSKNNFGSLSERTSSALSLISRRNKLIPMYQTCNNYNSSIL